MVVPVVPVVRALVPGWLPAFDVVVLGAEVFGAAVLGVVVDVVLGAADWTILVAGPLTLAPEAAAPEECPGFAGALTPWAADACGLVVLGLCARKGTMA